MLPAARPPFDPPRTKCPASPSRPTLIRPNSLPPESFGSGVGRSAFLPSTKRSVPPTTRRNEKTTTSLDRPPSRRIRNDGPGAGSQGPRPEGYPSFSAREIRRVSPEAAPPVRALLSVLGGLVVSRNGRETPGGRRRLRHPTAPNWRSHVGCSSYSKV